MDKITLETWKRVRDGAEVVEADPWGDKVLLLPDGTYVKLFRRKRLISSAAWYPYAQRFADNALALAARGVPCPRVIDVLRIPSIGRDAVHYHPLPGQTLRAIVREGSMDDNEHACLHDAFNRFVRRLHNQGIYFRSLHLGNVVMTPLGELGLIDISDIRVHRQPLSGFWRRRNLRRMEAIADERDWIDHDTILRAKD